MTITNNPYFGSNTSDDIKRGFSSISSMFAPPSGADLAGYASARESRAKADLEAQKLGIIEKLKSDPHYSGADAGILADLYDPNASFYAVDKNNATELAKNAADNQQKFVSTMYGPLSQDAMRPAVPADVAKLFDIHGEMPAVNGLRSALTETQVKGAILQGLNLTPEQKLALGMSGVDTTNIVGPDGKPQVVYKPDAVGQQPAYAPNREIMSEGYGNPGEGLVWARDADGNVKLDDRGAPIAVPFQGGKVWQQQQDDQASSAAREQNTDLKGGVVVQDIDRALNQIDGNPMLTTGVGSQATSWLGGTPAQSVSALLDSVRSNTGFDQLQQMRASSPTGGALGPVSDKENQLLQSVLGSIDPKQPAPQLLDNLKRVKNIYLDIIHGVGNGPPRERLSFPSQWGQYAAPEAKPANEVTHGDLPQGVTEADVQFTAEKYGLTREQVLQRLGGH